MLLNPPAASAGTRTRNAVNRAARVLGYEKAVIANLCATPTPTVVQIGGLGHESWDDAQADLTSALSGASAMVAGWGVSGLKGDARRWLGAQVDWIATQAEVVGITTFWMVGGEPRHPSRWHQYVSDKYGRTSGGTFEERLAQVLVEVPLRQ